MTSFRERLLPHPEVRSFHRVAWASMALVLMYGALLWLSYYKMPGWAASTGGFWAGVITYRSYYRVDYVCIGCGRRDRFDQSARKAAVWEMAGRTDGPTKVHDFELLRFNWSKQQMEELGLEKKVNDLAGETGSFFKEMK